MTEQQHKYHNHQDLRNFDFVTEPLRLSYFENSNLEKADLSEGNFDGSSFEHSSLKRVTANHASFRDTNLNYVEAHHASFQSANLSCAKAKFTDFSNANFMNANMESVNFSHSNFNDANLGNASLLHTSLFNVDFGGANLRKADLRGAKLTNANLNCACFEDVKFDDNTIIPRGQTWKTYYSETLPQLLTVTGKTIKQILDTGCWDCHSWNNCPMHEVFGIEYTSQAPSIYIPLVRDFLMWFDNGLLDFWPEWAEANGLL